MRDIETERWFDCKRELRLRGARQDVNTFTIIDEISYRAITYLGCSDVNPTAVAEDRDA